MAKGIPWREEAALTDWTEYSQQSNDSYRSIGQVTVSQFSRRAYDPYLRIITPTSPKFTGKFDISVSSWNLYSGNVKVWIAEQPGGTALNEYEKTLSSSGDGWSFKLNINPDYRPSRGEPPALYPSTTYYVCFEASRAGERSAENSNTAIFTARGRGSYPAYSEVAPPPAPPDDPTAPPPEPPDLPDTSPTDNGETPPTTTEGTNNPPGASLPTPDFSTATSEDTSTHISDVAAPKPAAVANTVGGRAATKITAAIVGQVGFGVPEAKADSESLFRTVEGLKVFQEQITRQRGDRGKSALLVEELPTIIDELVRELDKRYATNYIQIEIPTADVSAPDVVTDVNGVASSLVDHLTNTAIHITEPPSGGTWGRRRGAWVRTVGFDDLAQYVPDEIIAVEATSGGSVIDTQRGGFISQFQLADNVVPGQVCNINASGTMGLADASAQASSNSLLGLALATGTAGSAIEFLINGYYNMAGFTTGEQLYLDPATPGGLTITVPSGSLEVVRVTGYATSATEIYFNPDRTWIVLA